MVVLGAELLGGGLCTCLAGGSLPGQQSTLNHQPARVGHDNARVLPLYARERQDAFESSVHHS